MSARRIEYLVRLRPDVQDRQPANSLKRALKVLLRAFGLKAVTIEEIPADQQPTGRPGESDGVRKPFGS